LYKNHHATVQKELEAVDKNLYTQIQNDLTKSNKTLYEASSGVNTLYINSFN